MKKGLLALLAGVMAFGVAVQSMASARIDALSSDPRLIEDHSLIWMYPNKVLQYKNTVEFRLFDPNFNGGGGTAEWGGLLIEEETFGGVVGIYVNRPNRFYTTADFTVTPGFNSPVRYYWNAVGNPRWWMANPRSTNIVDLFYGTALEGADLGIHLNYGDNGVDPSTRQSQNVALALGLGFADAGPFSEANLKASYAFQSITNTSSSTDNTDNGIYTIKVGGLAQSEVDDNTSMRLSADVQLDQYDMTDLNSIKTSGLGVLLGLGCNHKVNGGKGMVSHGLLLDWASFSADDTSEIYDANTWALIWTGSVETEVAAWLVLRAGLQAALLANAYDEEGWWNGGSTYYDAKGSPVVFNTGFGINWQNFVLDAVVSVASLEALIAGPNAGAGIFYPGTNGPAGQGIVAVSQADLKYRF